jgi:hypothetical protein
MFVVKHSGSTVSASSSTTIKTPEAMMLGIFSFSTLKKPHPLPRDEASFLFIRERALRSAVDVSIIRLD